MALGGATRVTTGRQAAMAVLAVLVAALAIAAAGDVAARDGGGRLERIRDRGELIVGVRTNAPPFGTLAEDGRIVGLEPALARRLANAIDVDLELEPVTASNRLRKLEQGVVDVVIAGMRATAARDDLAGMLAPHYYASGVNVLLDASAGITSWAELKGRSVCLTRGAAFNQALIRRHGIAPRVFGGPREARMALRQGQCVAWAHDSARLRRLADDAAWDGFTMPLAPMNRIPWAVAVPRGAEDGPFGRFVTARLIAWQRKDVIARLGARHGLEPTAFVREQHAQWTATHDDGGYVCAQQADGGVPAYCHRDGQDLARGDAESGARGPVAAAFDNLGLPTPAVADAANLRMLLDGMTTTLVLGVVAILGSLGYGVVAGTLFDRLPGGLARMVRAGNAVFHLTPPIISLYLVFFGMGGWAAANLGLQLTPFAVAAVILSLYTGSSNAVIVSAALAQEREREPDMAEPVRLAHAVERASAGLVNNAVTTIKAVGLASTIAVPELIFASGAIIAQDGSAGTMVNVLLVFYLAIVSTFLVVLTRLKQGLLAWAATTSSQPSRFGRRISQPASP